MHVYARICVCVHAHFLQKNPLAEGLELQIAKKFVLMMKNLDTQIAVATSRR